MSVTRKTFKDCGLLFFKHRDAVKEATDYTKGLDYLRESALYEISYPPTPDQERQERQLHQKVAEVRAELIECFASLKN